MSTSVAGVQQYGKSPIGASQDDSQSRSYVTVCDTSSTLTPQSDALATLATAKYRPCHP